MKRFVRNLLICLSIPLVGWGVYLLVFPTYKIRYRLTVDLEVDGRPLTSTGVVETWYQIRSNLSVNLLGGTGLVSEFKGYAVTIDLGERGLLFLINFPAISPSTCFDPSACSGPLHPYLTRLSDLPFNLLGIETWVPPDRAIEAIHKLKAHPEAIDVPLNKLPMVMRFRKVDDCLSNEQVDPEHLDLTFGPNVRMVRVELQLTHDHRGDIPARWPVCLRLGHDSSIEQSGQHVSLGTGPFKGYFD